MGAEHVIELDYENFDGEVFGTDKPVLVEFYSESYYSCRQVDGIVDALAGEFEGKIVFGRVDMDANWQTAEDFDVRRAPTVLLFQHDRVVDRIEEPKTRSEYQQSLYELITQYWVI
jgi:thioredoxin 1